MFFPRQNVGNPFFQFGSLVPFHTPELWQAVQALQQHGLNPFIQSAIQPSIARLAALGQIPPQIGAINPLLAQSTLQQGFGSVFQPTPFQQTPFQQVPFQQTPFQQVPFQQTPFQQVPFQQTPFQQTPFQQVPFQQMPFLGGLPFAGQFENQFSGGQFGAFGSPTGNPFGAATAQSTGGQGIGCDPITGIPLTQQLNPAIQQYLPVRSLINPLGVNQQLTPYAQPPVDPVSLLLQAQLVQQLSANPYQQLLRGYSGTPWQTPGFSGIQQGIGYPQQGLQPGI